MKHKTTQHACLWLAIALLLASCALLERPAAPSSYAAFTAALPAFFELHATSEPLPARVQPVWFVREETTVYPYVWLTLQWPGQSVTALATLVHYTTNTVQLRVRGSSPHQLNGYVWLARVPLDDGVQRWFGAVYTNNFTRGDSIVVQPVQFSCVPEVLPVGDAWTRVLSLDMGSNSSGVCPNAEYRIRRVPDEESTAMDIAGVPLQETIYQLHAVYDQNWTGTLYCAGIATNGVLALYTLYPGMLDTRLQILAPDATGLPTELQRPGYAVFAWRDPDGQDHQELVALVNTNAEQGLRRFGAGALCMPAAPFDVLEIEDTLALSTAHTAAVAGARAPVITATSPTTLFTSVAAWINVRDTNQSAVILAAGPAATPGTGDGRWLLYEYGFLVALTINGEERIALQTLVTKPGWVHVAVVFPDGPIYVDGEEAAAERRRRALRPKSLLAMADEPARGPFNGLVRNVRLYRRVLTPEQAWRSAAERVGR